MFIFDVYNVYLRVYTLFYDVSLCFRKKLLVRRLFNHVAFFIFTFMLICVNTHTQLYKDIYTYKEM